MSVTATTFTLSFIIYKSAVGAPRYAFVLLYTDVLRYISADFFVSFHFGSAVAAGVEATVVKTAVVSFAFVVVAAVVTLTVAGSVLSSYIVLLVAAAEEEKPVSLWLPSI